MVGARYRNKGFTQVELLVVIAIIAILAALLFPMMSAAKKKAGQTKCMNNMSQIGKAIMMYADDNQGYTPFAWNTSDWSTWNRDTWRERIQRNLKNHDALLCPVKTHSPRFKNIGHYGINVYITMKDVPPPAKPTVYVGYRLLSSIPQPSKTILISENQDGDWSAEPWDNNDTGDNGRFYPYHGDESSKGGEFSFCDGHAKFMSVSQTEQDNFYYWHVLK